MYTDAHCHPLDLFHAYKQAEEERKNLNAAAAANACSMEEFAYNETLAFGNVFPCYAIHPQLPAVIKNDGIKTASLNFENELENLKCLASSGRLAAVGECGFDLYNTSFKETEAVQEMLFIEQLNTALKYNLPVIIHARRAMHKIFYHVKALSKCKAVVFHSWSGTLEEGQALIRKNVNAYFSFGNIIINGHKRAMKCCALFPSSRLLTETDAPFQPRRGRAFSSYADLPLVIETAAALRSEAQGNVTAAQELEAIIEKNFFDVFHFTGK